MADGGASLPNFGTSPRRATRSSFAAVAPTRAVWAMGIGHFGATYPLYFIIIWVPLFLTKSRGFSIIDMTYLATLGFLAQAVSAVAQGWWSDRMVRAGHDEAALPPRSDGIRQRRHGRSGHRIDVCASTWPSAPASSCSGSRRRDRRSESLCHRADVRWPGPRAVLSASRTGWATSRDRHADHHRRDHRLDRRL